MDSNSTVFSLGHSNRSRKAFLSILVGYRIDVLADVRSYPSSKKFPHFNAGNLRDALSDIDVAYDHLESLGGYVGTIDGAEEVKGWKADGFKNYAAYTRTETYKNGLEQLERLAREQRTAFMCAEGWYRKCHRQIISDSLLARGWEVFHIQSASSKEKHTPPEFARIQDGEVVYQDGNGTKNE